MSSRPRRPRPYGDIGAFEVQPNSGPPGQTPPPGAPALQKALRVIQSLQRSGARVARLAFGDFTGDFTSDIVPVFKLRNGRLLLTTFNGVTGQMQAPFTTVQGEAKNRRPGAVAHSGRRSRLRTGDNF